MEFGDENSRPHSAARALGRDGRQMGNLGVLLLHLGHILGVCPSYEFMFWDTPTVDNHPVVRTWFRVGACDLWRVLWIGDGTYKL